MERDSEERSVMNDSKRYSVHSGGSDLILIDVDAEYQRIYHIRKRPDTRLHMPTVLLAAPVAEAAAAPPFSLANTHKTVKNIVLVPYTPKPNEWGSWWVKKSQLTSSTVATPNSVLGKDQESEQEWQEEEIGQVHQPHSPYYLLVHPLEFYDDE